MIYVGLDDTDNKDSRGTGRLARGIAAVLGRQYPVLGVTRHQLLVDPRVPYTSHNSSATIHLGANGGVDLTKLADEVQALMLADFQQGSDPGLCVSRVVDGEISAFGRRAQRELLSQPEAYNLAERHGCLLRGLGGTRDGVIGALAAVGLAATGEDGRFLMVGSARDLKGVETIPAILASGIAEVRTMDGERLVGGMVDTGGKLRPAFREGRPILFVRPGAEGGSVWLPVKLD